MEKDPEQLVVYGLKIIRRILGLKKRKWQIKYLEKKSNCVVCWSNKSRFKKKKIIIITTDVIKIRWRLTGWSEREMLKMLTQKCLEQKITY